ncbi:hypothetical protein A3715_15275 [Oleiphilus sp. HI0009]|nr:hypothetical protein A3715_15275 [Oleiphilus sp. HI0009]
MSEFKLSIGDWAELNRRRYGANQKDSRVIGFEHGGVYVTNPFLDISGIDEVSPLEVYGEKYEKWMARYQESVIENANAKNSNS